MCFQAYSGGFYCFDSKSKIEKGILLSDSSFYPSCPQIKKPSTSEGFLICGDELCPCGQSVREAKTFSV